MPAAAHPNELILVNMHIPEIPPFITSPPRTTKQYAKPPQFSSPGMGRRSSQERMEHIKSFLARAGSPRSKAAGNAFVGLCKGDQDQDMTTHTAAPDTARNPRKSSFVHVWQQHLESTSDADCASTASVTDDEQEHEQSHGVSRKLSVLNLDQDHDHDQSQDQHKGQHGTRSRLSVASLLDTNGMQDICGECGTWETHGWADKLDRTFYCTSCWAAWETGFATEDFGTAQPTHPPRTAAEEDFGLFFSDDLDCGPARSPVQDDHVYTTTAAITQHAPILSEYIEDACSLTCAMEALDALHDLELWLSKLDARPRLHSEYDEPLFVSDATSCEWVTADTSLADIQRAASTTPPEPEPHVYINPLFTGVPPPNAPCQSPLPALSLPWPEAGEEGFAIRASRRNSRRGGVVAAMLAPAEVEALQRQDRTMLKMACLVTWAALIARSNVLQAVAAVVVALLFLQM